MEKSVSSLLHNSENGNNSTNNGLLLHPNEFSSQMQHDLKKKLSNLSQLNSVIGNLGLEINFNGNQMFRVVSVDKYCALLACWNFGDSDNCSSIPFCKVFDVERGEFLIPPTHVFYCVTTSMCILIGLVNNSSVFSDLPLLSRDTNHEEVNLSTFDIARKTLDKFADYLLESGY